MIIRCLTFSNCLVNFNQLNFLFFPITVIRSTPTNIGEVRNIGWIDDDIMVCGVVLKRWRLFRVNKETGKVLDSRTLEETVMLPLWNLVADCALQFHIKSN